MRVLGIVRPCKSCVSYSLLIMIPGTRVLKCREGLNNKAYILTMDNGSELFAKLPNPIAGPAFYTTASEVATRQFASSLTTQESVPNPDFGTTSYAMH
jgi:hypothetical protein